MDCLFNGTQLNAGVLCVCCCYVTAFLTALTCHYRRWIDRYITQLEKMTPHEQMTLPDTADTTESNTSTRDSDGVIEPYQIFQAVPKATEVEATAVTNIEQQPPSAESEAGSR